MKLSLVLGYDIEQVRLQYLSNGLVGLIKSILSDFYGSAHSTTLPLESSNLMD